MHGASGKEGVVAAHCPIAAIVATMALADRMRYLIGCGPSVSAAVLLIQERPSGFEVRRLEVPKTARENIEMDVPPGGDA